MNPIFVEEEKAKEVGGAEKIPVFGILKPGGKVYTQGITNTQSAILLPIIQ